MICSNICGVVMVVSNVYDHAKRVRSYEIVAEMARSDGTG